MYVLAGRITEPHFFTIGCFLVSLLYQQLSVLIQQHPYFFLQLIAFFQEVGVREAVGILIFYEFLVLLNGITY